MRKVFLLSTMLLLFTMVAFAQTSPITGQVKNSRGEPVPFATVIVKGSKTSVYADQNGNFSIQATKGSTLVFSAASFDPFEAVVGSESALSVILKSQSNLQEVVVTALGVSRGREKLGYSATTFKTEDINRTSPVSALDGLQGKVAGADISTIGGQPGASSKIILRGYSSLQGSNQALIVVDGVPFNNSRLGSGTRGPATLNAQGGQDFGNGLNDLNPNDIETITILKGAAASSLYGSRAQNGVVLITTKKGRSGKLSIDFSSATVFSSVGKLPDFQNTWGQGWNGLHYKEENGSWGPKLDGKDRLWGSTVDNSRLLKPFTAAEDNVRDFYDYGIEENNSLSLRGGNENANFYFSYNNVYSDGVLPSNADSYKRNTFSLRSSLKAGTRFTINSSFNYINKMGRTVSSDDDESGSSTFENIIQIGRDIPITDFKAYNNKFFNVDNYFTPYAANPYFSLYENGNQLNLDRFFGNLDMTYKITDWLNIQSRTGGDFSNARIKDWQAVESPKPGSWRGPNPTNFEGASYTAKVGGLTEGAQYSGELNSELFLNLNKDIGRDFNITGFVGGSFNQRESRVAQSRITQLTIPGFYNLSNSSVPPVATATLTKRRLFGAIASANIGYKDFAFLTLNARNDYSSTLPASSRSFFYPGASVSFVISKLADLSKAKIDFLKVRAAYGRTGNDASPYLTESVLAPGNILLGFGNLLFPLNNVSGFEVSNTIANAALKPEITSETEIGAEGKFFNSRVGFDVSLYQKVSNGQILNVPVASTSGFNSLVTNFGKVENKGIEVSLNLVPIKSKNFNWEINYTFTKNRNTVIDLPPGLDKVDFSTYYDVKLVARAGKPMGIIEAPTVQKTADGKYIATSTGFYATTNEDVPYGNVQRDFIMGLNNSFTFKGIRLGFTFDYRMGGSMVSRTADLTYFVGNAYLTQYNDRRPFVIPNSVVQTGTDASGKPTYEENNTPIDVTNFNSYFYHTSNKGFAWGNLILPKSFLKLRDVTLSYTLPKSWSSKISAQAITISAIGRNFLLWTPKKNTFIDPEVSDISNDFLGEFGEVAASPSVKFYGFSVKIGF